MFKNFEHAKHACMGLNNKIQKEILKCINEISIPVLECSHQQYVL